MNLLTVSSSIWMRLLVMTVFVLLLILLHTNAGSLLAQY